MKDEEVRHLYVQGLQELNFDQCMKAVGILAEKEDPNALWLEAEVLYLRGEYENCLYIIGDNRKKESIELNEYYIASLLMLGRYRDVRRQLRYCEKYYISKSFVYFLEVMMRKQNERLPNRIGVCNYPRSPFLRHHTQLVIQELIDVYELQLDKLQLAASGFLNTNSGSGPDILKKISVININEDSFSEIKKAVETDTPIDPVLILKLFIKGVKTGLNEENVDGRKGQLRDILALIDIERRLGLYDELIKTLREYECNLRYSMEKGNKITAGHLKEVLFDLESVINRDAYSATISSIRNILMKRFPEMLQEEERLEVESRVYRLLHNQTKPMYKAAVWQYNMVSLDQGYGYRDAGMYCLAYIRLLECEMNNRVFPVLEHHYEAIRERSAFLSSKKKQSWNINRFNPNRKSDVRLTAGQWHSFFAEFKEENMAATAEQCSDFSELISWIAKQEIFNDIGYSKLVSGRVAEIFDQTTIIERYRNPPAHTKYVTISIANECRGFVENSIIELSGYYK